MTPIDGKPTDAQIATLTRRLVSLESEAWVEFHALYAVRLFRYLLAMLPAREAEAQDGLQNTFVRVVRHIRVFESEPEFWGWLTVLARSARRDDARKEGRLARLLQRLQGENLTASNGNPIPGTEAATPPIAERLDVCVAALEAKDRVLLQEKYTAGISVRAIATSCGASEKAIESRLSRLRSHLRKQVQSLLSHEPTL